MKTMAVLGTNGSDVFIIIEFHLAKKNKRDIIQMLVTLQATYKTYCLVAARNY
jgi:hypothetical protein